MTNLRVPTRILCAIVWTPLLCAQDLSSYRKFQFGTNLSVAAKQAGMKPSEARLVHQRPALIQELEWQPRGFPGSAIQADPVKQGLLCFYNGELFRIVITYDRYKVEGMTAEDMIAAISATYGPSTRPTAEISYRSIYSAEVAPVIARWEDSQYTFNLVRSGDRSSFVMVLYSKRLDALAETAIAEAVRLDTQEAPQREIEKQKKREEEEGLVLEKARAANKPNFRP